MACMSHTPALASSSASAPAALQTAQQQTQPPRATWMQHLSAAGALACQVLRNLLAALLLHLCAAGLSRWRMPWTVLALCV